jgi:predicted nicotinamide N-methyase
VPEVRLHLATEVTPLWEATEATLARTGLPPPYWAFAWPGGQAIARHILDNPAIVRGRRVFDFAAGSGLVAVAAAMAGAANATAAEIDDFAVAAIVLNAAANAVTVAAVAHDVVGTDPAADLILCGDVCYERPMTDHILPWLRARARLGTEVWLGDPGRAYLPKDGLVPIADYAVPTPLDLEDRTVRETRIWRLSA